MTLNLTHWIPAFALATAVALPMSLQAEENQQDKDQQKQQQQNQEQSQQGGEEQKKDDKKQATKLHVFELKHSNPQELNQVVMLIERASAAHDAAHAQHTQGQAAVNTAGYRGAANTGNQLYTSVHADKKILFVRGSEEQIKKVEELVNAFDVNSNELQEQEFHGVCLIPVKQENAQQVNSTLQQLNLRGQMMQMGETTLIAIRGSDMSKEEVDQAKQVIEKLNSSSKDDAEKSDAKDGQEENQKAEEKKSQTEEQK